MIKIKLFDIKKLQAKVYIYIEQKYNIKIN